MATLLARENELSSRRLGSVILTRARDITHPESIIREVMFKLNLVSEPPAKEMIKQTFFPPDASLLVHPPPSLIKGSFVEIIRSG